MQTVMDTTCAEFTDAELDVVRRFIARANSLAGEAIASVRDAE